MWTAWLSTGGWTALALLLGGALMTLAQRRSEEPAAGLQGAVRRIVTGDSQTRVRDHIPEALDRLGSRGDELLQEKRRKTLEQIRNLARATRRQLGLRKKRSASGDGLRNIHSRVHVPKSVAGGESEVPPSELLGDDPDALAAFDALVASDIFSLPDRPLLVALCRSVKLRRFEPGDVVYDEGQEVATPSLLVVREGRVEVRGAGGGEVAAFAPGSVLAGQFELLAFLLGKPFRCCARAVATEPTALVCLSDAATLQHRSQHLMRNALVRLCRVTMLTGVRYLGLAHEYVSGTTATGAEADARALASRVLGVPEAALPPVQPVLLSPEEDVTEVLSIEDMSTAPALDDKHMQVFTIPAGRTVLDMADSAWLCLVLAGELTVSVNAAGEGVLGRARERHLCSVRSGGSVGLMALLTAGWQEWFGSRDGQPPLLNVVATEDTRVVRLSEACVHRLAQRHPSIVAGIAADTVEAMPATLRDLDLATAWENLRAGDRLLEQGDACDAMYVVLQGRLRGVVGEQVVREFGRGSIVGETEILLSGRHPAAVVAVRDAQLARVPAAILFSMAQQFPDEVLVHFLRMTAMSMRRGVDAPSAEDKQNPIDSLSIAVLPVSGSVPLALFTRQLHKALSTLCPTALLSSESAAAQLGLHVPDDEASGHAQFDIKNMDLLGWLGDKEEGVNVVLYEADWSDSSWTRMCIRQADVVLLVGNAADPPLVGDLEEQLTTNAQRTLVLLHVNPGPTYRPSHTRDWIENREGVQAHYHVRLITSAKQQLQSPQGGDSVATRDFSRLARCLTGTAMGLVLGGGGARGLAQLGVLRVLEEQNVPVDMIGGTSIGSFVGGLYAMEGSHLAMAHPAYRYSAGMASLWNKIKDLTVPISSYFHGGAFNEGVRSVFGRQQKIEDLWLPFFCVTTDLSTSREMIHENGTLWRYVRASMSLAGYLPPLCDRGTKDPVTGEEELHYLVDGGYVNNLPADVMKRNGAGTIIAVDVGADWTFAGHNYGDSLSGLWQLLRKLNPWAKPLKIPSMADISSQLAYVSSVRQLETARTNFVDLYLRIPPRGIGTLEFGRYREIEQLGYEFAGPEVARWKDDLIRSNDYRTRLLFTTTGRKLKKTRSFSLVEEMLS